MAAKKEPGRAWRHTTVLVRADIFAKAQEQGIDISDTCNQALADLLGVDYRQQQLDSVPVPPPVIIAKNGGLPTGVPDAKNTSPQPPVINADDPKAAGTITGIKRQPVKRAPASPMQESAHPAPEKQPAKAIEKGTATAPAPKGKRTAPKKAEKGDPIKKFLAAMIVREDDKNTVIAKEELYQIFSRWCREQKVTLVPDQKAVTVALKTRYAFTDRNTGGKPCWTNVRFR